MKTRMPRAWPVLGLLVLAGCVDGLDTTGPGMPRTVSIVAMPRFVDQPSPTLVARLNTARVTLVDMSNGATLVAQERTVAPGLNEWSFELLVEVIEGDRRTVRLDIELIDAVSTVPVTEYSGRTTFEVRAAVAVAAHQIDLGRGPPANLSMTALSLRNDSGRLLEGASRSMEFDVVGASPGQVVYFESSVPGVATVDGAGMVRAVAPGRALVIARAGHVADTLALDVSEVTVPPASEVRRVLSPKVDYVAGDLFMASLSNAEAATRMRDALLSLMNAMLSGNGAESVDSFERAAKEWDQYGKGTALRFLEGPQLSVIAIALMHAADALGVDFL